MLLLLSPSISGIAHTLSKHVNKIIHLLSTRVLNRWLGLCLLRTEWITTDKRILGSSFIKKLMALNFKVILRLLKHWGEHFTDGSV
jgi:hypothetical protein